MGAAARIVLARNVPQADTTPVLDLAKRGLRQCKVMAATRTQNAQAQHSKSPIGVPY